MELAHVVSSCAAARVVSAHLQHPETSRERLALASPDSPSASTKTILYLAYGSNLCAETFLGRRGIRPVSQINVSAPAFDLSFDLPGIPYNEPCFANTRPRKIPGIPGQPPKFPPPPYSAAAAAPASKPTWSKGVYGVVYEVTPETTPTSSRRRAAAKATTTC